MKWIRISAIISSALATLLFLHVGIAWSHSGDEFYVNGRRVEADVLVPLYQGGEPFVPIRFVAEAMEWGVRWYPQAPRVVTIVRNLEDIQEGLCQQILEPDPSTDNIAAYDQWTGYQCTPQSGFEPMCGLNCIQGVTVFPITEPLPQPEQGLRLKVDLTVEVDRPKAIIRNGRAYLTRSFVEELLDVTIRFTKELDSWPEPDLTGSTHQRDSSGLLESAGDT